jgi:hypothetical protein
MSVYNDDGKIVNRNFRQRGKPAQLGEPQMSFGFFVHTMKGLLVFEPNEEWDVDKWNEEYVVFRLSTREYWRHYFQIEETVEAQIIKWAKFYYADETLDSNGFELKK